MLVQVDMWSLGCTSIQLAEGMPPFARMPAEEVRPRDCIMDVEPYIAPPRGKAIARMAQPPPPSLRHSGHWTRAFLSILEACLLMEPEARASASSLLSVRRWLETVSRMTAHLTVRPWIGAASPLAATSLLLHRQPLLETRWPFRGVRCVSALASARSHLSIGQARAHPQASPGPDRRCGLQ
jgi:serine/threonine protein kinase